jgi:CRISPR-associated protein Cmr2
VSWVLDLSIGPVQRFVGESRRTRDLWGSSYLLSFLSAQAAAGAATAGGTVHVVDSPLYRAVRHGVTGEAPRFGTVPNHFQVTVDGDPQTVATAAEDWLQRAWQQVCDAVWDRYAKRVNSIGIGTRNIWDRQVGGFWQVTWIAGEGDVRGLLHRRKHWHSQCPPDEPGDKCSVMPTFQELSGHIRTHGSRARSAQVAFWERLRSRVGPLDLREHERLCAVALVKRLFPAVAEAALGWGLDVQHWPSTVWVGALPWLHTVQDAVPEAADRYASEVTSVAEAAARPLPAPLAALAPAGRLATLDANYLHRGFVADPRVCPLPEAAEQDREPQARAALREQLGGLYRSPTGSADQPDVAGGPPVYYAVLRADGDKLGDLAADLQGRELVGQALAEFASGDGGVDALIGRHSGVPIYSGGDDVLAVLPVPEALRCASALARRYREAFQRCGKDGAHLSAAVLFAHVRLPLATALADSMRLLEKVAKERNDRDSLAVGVLKPGSRHCEWVSHWQRPSPDGRAAQAEAVALLDRLVQQLRPDGAEPGLSSSVLYRVREALSLLCGWPRWEPGRTEALPAGVDAKAYLRAEIGQSLAAHLRLTGDQEPEEELRRRVETLVSSIWPLLRHPAAGEGERIGLDALLLARFLAGGGHEEEHG